MSSILRSVTSRDVMPFRSVHLEVVVVLSWVVLVGAQNRAVLPPEQEAAVAALQQFGARVDFNRASVPVTQ